MFNFLFRKKTEPQAAPKTPIEEDLTPETEVLVKRRLNMNMPVDIICPGTSETFQGRIVSENNLSLIIGRLPGEMTLREVTRGEEVTLLAYNTELEHVRVTATVVDSTTVRLVLRNWLLEDDRSKRLSKRLPLNIKGNLYELRDTRMSHPKVCTVLDLSESGARIRTTEKLATGDNLRLQLEVFKGDGIVSMPSQVMWASAQDTVEFEYGLLFAEMEQRKVRDLRNSLKELEQRLKREMRS